MFQSSESKFRTELKAQFHFVKNYYNIIPLKIILIFFKKKFLKTPIFFHKTDENMLNVHSKISKNNIFAKLDKKFDPITKILFYIIYDLRHVSKLYFKYRVLNHHYKSWFTIGTFCCFILKIIKSLRTIVYHQALSKK